MKVVIRVFDREGNVYGDYDEDIANEILKIFDKYVKRGKTFAVVLRTSMVTFWNLSDPIELKIFDVGRYDRRTYGELSEVLAYIQMSNNHIVVGYRDDLSLERLSEIISYVEESFRKGVSAW